MTIELICIASEIHGDQTLLLEAEVIAGAGLVGDRYFGQAQKYLGQNITLIESEAIERFNQETHSNIQQTDTRRNLITRGIHLAHLVGQEFTIGNVRFRGVELCEPCSALGERLSSAHLAEHQVVAHWLHRSGLRADALSSGTIKVGDLITPVP